MPCLNCEKEIPNPRLNQKFCCQKCKDQFHDRTKTRVFIEDLLALFEKYGLTERVLSLGKSRAARKGPERGTGPSPMAFGGSAEREGPSDKLRLEPQEWGTRGIGRVRDKGGKENAD